MICVFTDHKSLYRCFAHFLCAPKHFAFRTSPSLRREHVSKLKAWDAGSPLFTVALSGSLGCGAGCSLDLVRTHATATVPERFAGRRSSEKLAGEIRRIVYGPVKRGTSLAL